MEQEPSGQESAATGTGEQDTAAATEQPTQEEQPMDQDS